MNKEQIEQQIAIKESIINSHASAIAKTQVELIELNRQLDECNKSKTLRQMLESSEGGLEADNIVRIGDCVLRVAEHNGALRKDCIVNDKCCVYVSGNIVAVASAILNITVDKVWSDFAAYMSDKK